MDRKEKIEQVILKELHDIEVMKKIRKINSLREAKRPVMTGRFGAQVQADLEAERAKHGHLVSQDAVPEDPRKAAAMYRAAGVTTSDGDSSTEDDKKEGSIDPKDAAEDAAARGNPSFKEPNASSATRSADEVATSIQNKEEELKKHLGELEKINPELSHKRVVTGRNALSGEESSKHLSAIDASHPHLSHITRKVRHLLGVN